MPQRVPLLIRAAMYNLRGGFLVRPLSIALGLGCLGAVLSELEESFPVLSGWAPRLLFPTHTDPQVAQIILGAIAASMMTVVSIVFAIMLMTLTLASMQFSPRIIVSFVRDRVTQWTLGIFLGTFLYCVAALPTARSLPFPFAPVFTVMGAILLAVSCVGWLLFFIHHISRAISVNHIVARIAADTIAVIDDMMPRPHRVGTVQEAPPSVIDWQTSIPCNTSGYIRFVDRHRLVSVAKEHRVKLHVLRRVGHFIPAGVPLIAVSKDGRLTPDAIDDLLGAFDLGPTRTLQQDIEFGVLQIVDIALKAISPAVNDPSTAINCIDHLSAIMIRFASREMPESVLYDPPGTIRVVIPWMGFDRLLEAAFEQIRLYAKADVAVSLRLLRAMGDIATATPDPDYRRTLILRAGLVVAGCQERLGGDELHALRSRLSALDAIQPV